MCWKSASSSIPPLTSTLFRSILLQVLMPQFLQYLLNENKTQVPASLPTHTHTHRYNPEIPITKCAAQNTWEAPWVAEVWKPLLWSDFLFKQARGTRDAHVLRWNGEQSDDKDFFKNCFSISLFTMLAFRWFSFRLKTKGPTSSDSNSHLLPLIYIQS